jgi:hypothetical protein
MRRPGLERFLRIAYRRGSLAASNVVRSSGSLLRMVYDYRPHRFPLPEVRERRLVILGSGPSLRESLPQFEVSRPSDIDFLSVNDGYRDPSFGRLKPSWHVVAFCLSDLEV